AYTITPAGPATDLAAATLPVKPGSVRRATLGCANGGRLVESWNATAFATPVPPVFADAVTVVRTVHKGQVTIKITASEALPQAGLSVPENNGTVILVVDVSGSMRANDVEPTRLDAAVSAMRTFLDKLPPQFKVGLVSFSSEPEVLSAPTRDRQLVREALG